MQRIAVCCEHVYPYALVYVHVVLLYGALIISYIIYVASGVWNFINIIIINESPAEFQYVMWT